MGECREGDCFEELSSAECGQAPCAFNGIVQHRYCVRGSSNCLYAEEGLVSRAL